MIADRAGNNVNLGRPITVGDTNRPFKDWVGRTDRNDYYVFSLGDRSSLDLGLVSQSANVRVQVLDKLGQVQAASRKNRAKSENQSLALEAGDYAVRVFWGNASKKASGSKYKLSLDATPLAVEGVGPSPTEETPIQTFDLGVLTSDRDLSDRVNATNPADIYTFTLERASQFEYDFSTDNGLAIGVLRDGAGGLVQPVDGVLAAGTYSFNVLASDVPIEAPYALTFDVTPDIAGDLPEGAFDLGTITGDRQVTNWLGNLNYGDYYRFTLPNAVKLSATLGELTSLGNIDLLDSNQFPLEMVQGMGESEIGFARDLQAGTYYLHVTQFGTGTNYSLELSVPVVDLTPSAFTAPTNLTAGSSFSANVGVKVANPSVEAAPPSRVAVYLSSDETITTGDRLLGYRDIAGIPAGGETALITLDDLTLPGVNDFFWGTNGTYHVGALVDSLGQITEMNESNNTSTQAGVGQTAVTIGGLPTSRPFNIEFDYTSDTAKWFTAERKVALEAAASIWEKVIQTDYGSPVDLLLNVKTSQQFDDRTLAVAHPGVNTLEFNEYSSWFFDATPNTADDLPNDQTDFLTVALHEIAHSLGFSASNSAFYSKVNNGQFDGTNARAKNGGNPIPLSGSHIAEGYEYGGSGMPLMAPVVPSGQRRLPTTLDLAILDDVGLDVNYALASQNLSSNLALSHSQGQTRCACASCLTTV